MHQGKAPVVFHRIVYLSLLGIVSCIQPVQIPQGVEFTFAASPTEIAHFPLDGDSTDIRRELQLTRAPGEASSRSLTFQNGAPEVTGYSQHLSIAGQPNQFVSVRRQDDERFVTFDESLSVSFWFRPEVSGTMLSILQARPEASDQLQVAQLDFAFASGADASDTVTFRVGDDSGVVANNATPAVLEISQSIEPLDDGWYHGAFVINPFRSGDQAVAFFLNGRRVARGELPGSLRGDEDALLRSLDIRLGADHTSSNPFQGGISDLRFESIYLTGVQVAQQLLEEGAELPRHTVTFKSNGAAGDPPLTVSFPEGSDIVMPDQGQMLNQGAVFAGWNTEPDGAGNMYDEETSVAIYNPVTVYAQWKTYIPASFRFNNAGGGEFSGMFPTTASAAELSIGTTFTIEIDPQWDVHRFDISDELSSAVSIHSSGNKISLSTAGLDTDNVYEDAIRVYGQNTATGRNEFWPLQFQVRETEAMAIVSGNQIDQEIGPIDLSAFTAENEIAAQDPVVVATIAITGSGLTDTVPEGLVSFSLAETDGLTPSFGYDFEPPLRELSFEGKLSAVQAGLNSIRITTGINPPNFNVQITVVLKEDEYFLNPVNGHFYQFVREPKITWSDALRDAGEKEFRGVPGHLVTITSSQENDFISNNIKDANNVWIAATNEDKRGTWIWAAGPEQGTHFWQGDVDGSRVEERFNSWSEGEPNNSGNNEHYAVTNWGGSSGRWNDLPNQNDRINGYIVEYSLTPDHRQFDGTVLNRVLVVIQ